jgi:hypothetical protein
MLLILDIALFCHSRQKNNRKEPQKGDSSWDEKRNSSMRLVGENPQIIEE